MSTRKSTAEEKAPREFWNLRLITIATSFMFIPAFFLGFASLWCFVFAACISLFWRIGVLRIVFSYSNLNTLAEIKACIGANLLVLVSVSSFITLLPQLIILLLIFSGFDPLTMFLDNQIYKLVAYLFFNEYPMSMIEESAVKMFFCASMFSSVLVFLGLCFSTTKEMRNTLCLLLFRAYKPEDVAKRQLDKFWMDLLSAAEVVYVGMMIVWFAHIVSQLPLTANINHLFYCLFSVPLAYVSVILVFSGNASIHRGVDKNYSKYLKNGVLNDKSN